MVKVNKSLYSTYLRKGTSTTLTREQKINEIIKIVGGEPTMVTKVLDMCVDYTLQSLRANPTELENMNVYNIKNKAYIDTLNSDDIVISPTHEERQMLEFLSKKTLIKRYADIYSYAISCIANIEKDLEEVYYGKQ